MRPWLSDRLVAIVDRLLALRPDDRFSSATEVAEALEALIGRSELGTSARRATNRAADAVTSLPAEPEMPLDWSRIESALRPKSQGAQDARQLVNRKESRPPSAKGISAHRKMLENEGVESGREVHANYRNELIQMNRAMAELRSTQEKDEAPATDANWLEGIGEWFGDYLSDPSAAHIIIAILVLFLVLALAMAFALR